MWCEAVIRNLDDAATTELDSPNIDWVDIEWNECDRLLKKQTRSGRPVRAALSAGKALRHHDVIYESAGDIVAINVLPCSVAVVEVKELGKAVRLALELGNLHLRVQIKVNQLIFLDNPQAFDAVIRLGLSWQKQVQRFEPETILSAPTAQLSDRFRLISRSKTVGSAGDSSRICSSSD
jgi:urease accessory protein UreE